MNNVCWSAIPSRIMEEVYHFFSPDNPKNLYLSENAPLHYNKLIDLPTGKHVRLMACNPSCLLGGSIPLVHALATMTVDSYLLKKKLGFSLFHPRDSETSLRNSQQLTIIESDEYKPVVNAVKTFLSLLDSNVSAETAKKVILAFISQAGRVSAHDDYLKSLFWLGAAGTISSFISTSFYPEAIYACVPFLLVTTASGFLVAKKNIEANKVTSWCCFLESLRNMMRNRSDFVGESNLFVIIHNDLTDFWSKASLFVGNKMHGSESFNQTGIEWEFILQKDLLKLAPCIKDFRNERGDKIFFFYKDLFAKMDTAESVEDFQTVRNVLMGSPSPQMFLLEEDKKSDIINAI